MAYRSQLKIRVGLVSYLGLNRLGLGLRFQRAARCGRDRYCQTNMIISEQMKPRKSLWAQIIRPPNPKIYVKPKLDNWVKHHKTKSPAACDLKRILLKLRQDGRFYQALQVYEWMRKKGIYKFSSSDYAVQFNLICKVRGRSAAVHYVKNLPKQARNDKTYGKLLRCYVDPHSGYIHGSPLFDLSKMKELGFGLSPRPFNEIMRINAYEPAHVLEVLAELKKSGVSPDNDSYRICISSFGLKYDVDGMERMLREMESQPHIVMDWCTYAVVAEFFDRGFLIDRANDALEKVRAILQNKDFRRRKPPNYLLEGDYENVIKSLVKLGELDEAMKFVKEWEKLGNSRRLDVSNIHCSIIEEYIKNGELLEAFYKIRAWSRREKKGRQTIGIDRLSRLLCKEYLKVGDVFQAFNCFRETHHNDAFQVDHPVVPMLFFKYLEEECGSFFPLRCTTARSIKHVTGTILFSEANPIQSIGYIHHGYSTQASSNMDYKSTIKSIVESGKLNEARKMVTEWEAASGNNYDDLNILKMMMIEGYCKKSFFMEAEAMVEAWTREKRPRVSEIWFLLASQYQLHGKLVRGFECIKRCFALTPELKGNYGMMFWTFMNGIQYSRGMPARGSGYFESITH